MSSAECTTSLDQEFVEDFHALTVPPILLLTGRSIWVSFLVMHSPYGIKGCYARFCESRGLKRPGYST